MKKRILVVDDEPDITLVVKLALEARSDYIVFEENHATRAVTTARKCDPDLIILDIMMPGRNGNEVAADLREDARLANVPIVFLTAVALPTASKDSNLHNGHRHYLPKPVDLAELVRRIDGFCQKGDRATSAPVS